MNRKEREEIQREVRRRILGYLSRYDRYYLFLVYLGRDRQIKALREGTHTLEDLWDILDFLDRFYIIGRREFEELRALLFRLELKEVS